MFAHNIKIQINLTLVKYKALTNYGSCSKTSIIAKPVRNDYLCAAGFVTFDALGTDQLKIQELFLTIYMYSEVFIISLRVNTQPHPEMIVVVLCSAVPEFLLE